MLNLEFSSKESLTHHWIMPKCMVIQSNFTCLSNHKFKSSLDFKIALTKGISIPTRTTDGATKLFAGSNRWQYDYPMTYRWEKHTTCKHRENCKNQGNSLILTNSKLKDRSKNIKPKLKTKFKSNFTKNLYFQIDCSPTR